MSRTSRFIVPGATAVLASLALAPSAFAKSDVDWTHTKNGQEKAHVTYDTSSNQLCAIALNSTKGAAASGLVGNPDDVRFAFNAYDVGGNAGGDCVTVPHRFDGRIIEVKCGFRGEDGVVFGYNQYVVA